MINFYKNKKVIITGAAGGLGKELSVQLNNFGANLFCVVSKNSDISKLSFCKKIYRCDFNNVEDVDSLIWNNVFDEVDILINCAGIFPIKSLEETSLEEFDTVMNVNFRVPFILIQRSIKTMKKQNQGLIINVGSSSSYNGSSTSGAYCISKHALLGMSRSYNKELKKYNIRSLIFSPGSIKTKMGKTDVSQDYETFLDPKEVAEYILYSSKFNNEMFIDESRMNRISVL